MPVLGAIPKNRHFVLYRPKQWITW